MDARSFGDFLNTKLNEVKDVIQSNIDKGNYKEIEAYQRNIGSRDILVEITSKMENLISDFYAKQNGSANSVDHSDNNA